ncbi:hypothetical protein ATSB10_20030 [Dyella thiooxydans]|uniref:Uncharacterized protein n=1 Tax=Dyella thiooxydans TaxID=445710 RepID=A0A160N1S8_9GAMM|nr:hypothetical protein ATSB10_20030 [Dyella thiooxydans]
MSVTHEARLGPGVAPDFSDAMISAPLEIAPSTPITTRNHRFIESFISDAFLVLDP